MYWNKVKLAATAALAAAVVMTGLGLLSADDKQPEKPVPAVKGGVTLQGWGTVTDPDGDCKFNAENNRLTIAIPGKDHALCIEQNRMNAPRVLRVVEGDFIAQVKVSGKFPQGATSVVQSRRAFHGAGLLLWAGEKTYVRLERAELNAEGTNTPYGSFELRRDGEFVRTVGSGAGNVEPEGTYLRLERRGGKVYGAVSADGKQWTSFEPIEVDLPRRVQVGVLAGHNTSSGYEPVFEELKVFQELAK